MKEQRYPQLDERAVTATLPNGLPVCVVPKPGFAKKCAYFVTNYGSMDTKFTWMGRAYDTPAGVAHYLEHKMFEMPDRDVMQEFSALGANPNAFTSYNMTAYYFTCTEHFEACLELLLTFVSTPYFTEESVERERGIIAQEIRMYEDSADSQVYEDLFAAMYRHHPVRVPIAGTVESIGAITPEILRSCYDAFYHPANMMLCVVGDVDPAQVVAAAERILPQERRPLPVRDYGPPEEPGCCTSGTCRQMDVAMPTFQMGFKCPWPGFGPAGARQELVGDLAAEALMGESSRLYLEKYFLQNGQRLHPEIELGARSLLVDLAAIGFGVAGVTEEFVHEELSKGRLRKLATDFEIPPRSVDLCVLRDVPLTPAAQRFADFVKDSLSQRSGTPLNWEN